MPSTWMPFLVASISLLVPASPRVSCSKVTSFTLAPGGVEYQLIRWDGQVFVYRLQRGIPELQDPELLEAVDARAVTCRMGAAKTRLPWAVLKAHLQERAFRGKDGRQAFMGIVKTNPKIRNRLELVQASEDGLLEPEAGWPLAGLASATPTGNILILGYRDDSAITVDQRGEPLLRVSKWLEF